MSEQIVYIRALSLITIESSLLNLSLFSEQIASQDAIEWIGLITGIIYVILAAYEKPSCWIFGIISSAAIAWKSYMEYLLIADAALQVFYIVIGFVGLWNWLRGQEGGLNVVASIAAASSAFAGNIKGE